MVFEENTLKRLIQSRSQHFRAKLFLVCVPKFPHLLLNGATMVLKLYELIFSISCVSVHHSDRSDSTPTFTRPPRRRRDFQDVPTSSSERPHPLPPAPRGSSRV